MFNKKLKNKVSDLEDRIDFLEHVVSRHTEQMSKLIKLILERDVDRKKN